MGKNVFVWQLLGLAQTSEAKAGAISAGQLS
jgi:hypothetical protein